MGPKQVRSSVLMLEEAAIVAFRRHALLPLDSGIPPFDAFIPSSMPATVRHVTITGC